MARLRSKRLILLLVVIAVLAVAFNVATTVGPRLTTGDAALAAMTGDEREYYDRAFSRVTVGMDEAAVRDLLGEPVQPMILSAMSWHGPGHRPGRESKVIVRFDEGRVSGATWYRRTGLFSGFFCRASG
jgi:hypothetical protein